MKLRVELTDNRVVQGDLVTDTPCWLYLDENGFSHMIDKDYIVKVEVVNEM